MKVLIRASREQLQELLSHNKNNAIEFFVYEDKILKADLYVDALYEEAAPIFDSIIDKPVIVGCLLKKNNELPKNYVRINTWFGSLKKNTWEVVCINENLKCIVNDFFNALSIQPIYVSDAIGLIIAPTISMIINEAYFALQDKVSTKQDIDTAMKLGTNYPYGPFEWGEKIGLKKIYTLLKTLEEHDEKYKPSDLLIKEALA